MVNAMYRYGPVLLYGLEAALFVGLMWSLIQHYGSLVVLLLELAVPGPVVVVPVLIALGKVIRRRVSTRRAARHEGPEPERRVRPLLPLVLGVLSLATLLVLWLSAPAVLNHLLAQQGLATAGVVVRSADQHTAEAVFDQAGSLSHAEVYLTTQVKPLAVNGVPLVQLIQETRPMLGPNPPPGAHPPTLQDQLQALINKFTGIQGYDLAHGQFPDGAGMGFDPGWGKGGSGYNGSGIGPQGRLLDAHDARTLNVLIPRDFGGLSYLTFNGDTITVQSLVTGQMLDLHVVGEYEPDGSATTPLFGRVLADDSVVQTLSGGHPSYAYGLHLDGNQLQMVFERLHTRVPTAQLYNFLSDPIGPDTEPPYALFTDPDPAGGFFDSNINPPPLLGAVAGFWAALLTMIIALNWGACMLIDHSGLRMVTERLGGRRPVMIHAFRYEPRGERQRFEPREQQRSEREEQDRHFHLNPTFRASQGRSTQPNAIRITRILAALVGATVIPLWVFEAIAQDGLHTPNTLSWIAWISFLAGLVLAWGFGCLPLLVSAWRASPRVRFLLLVLLLIIPLSFLPGLWLGAIIALLGILRIRPGLPFLLFLLLRFVHPLISAILLTYVSREAGVLRQEAPTDSRPSFVVVSGMVLMLLGGLFLNLSAILDSPLLFLPAMCVAVIVAMRTLFELSRWRENAQARPKDVSPSDVDSSGEPREDRG